MTGKSSPKTTAFPPEGQTVEWKESLGEGREIVETCAAFASADGGRVYIGVAPDGSPAQLEVGKHTLERLANRIAENTHPKVVPAIGVDEVEGRQVVVVEVPASATKPVFAFDRAFRRSGRTNQRLDPDEAARLYLESRGMTWDTMALDDLGIDDVDPDLVTRFLRRARREREWEVDPDTPPEMVLVQMGLLRESKLTVAGNLLFGAQPQRHLVQSEVRCARFKGNDTVRFLDMKVIRGNVIDQVEEAMAFVQRHISMAAEIKGFEREETWEYPLEAVRESIVNAVCHRDYASTANVLVRIFDDSLQVGNPGGLPEGLTVDDLRRVHESRPRNRLIAHAFFLVKHIEQFGTGSLRMIDLCRDAGLPEPEYESRPGWFEVTFHRPPPLRVSMEDLGLNERQREALRYVEARGHITAQGYRALTEVSKTTGRRDLSDLVAKGVLRKSGVGKATRYVFGMDHPLATEGP